MDYQGSLGESAKEMFYVRQRLRDGWGIVLWFCVCVGVMGLIEKLRSDVVSLFQSVRAAWQEERFEIFSRFLVNTGNASYHEYK